MFSRARTAPRSASRRTASAAAGLLVLLGALTMSSAAMAGKPKGEFADFADCPLSTAGVNECVYSKATSGELAFGKMVIPIKAAIVFQGGLDVTEKEEAFVAPTEGETLSKTAEEVTGGFESKPLTATLELVSPAAVSRTRLSAEEGER